MGLEGRGAVGLEGRGAVGLEGRGAPRLRRREVEDRRRRGAEGARTGRGRDCQARAGVQRPAMDGMVKQRDHRKRPARASGGADDALARDDSRRQSAARLSERGTRGGTKRTGFLATTS